MGNIHAHNKIPGDKRILLSAHMDTVGTLKPVILAYTDTENRTILTGKNATAIGGDDKCGVWIASKLLHRKNIKVPLSVIFSVGEEGGLKGRRYAINTCATWFEPMIYAICLERKSNDDIICNNAGINRSS